jgi:hypothetical protein
MLERQNENGKKYKEVAGIPGFGPPPHSHELCALPDFFSPRRFIPTAIPRDNRHLAIDTVEYFEVRTEPSGTIYCLEFKGRNFSSRIFATETGNSPVWIISLASATSIRTY